MYQTLRNRVAKAAMDDFKEFTSDGMYLYCLIKGYVTKDLTPDEFEEHVTTPMMRDKTITVASRIPDKQKPIPLYRLNWPHAEPVNARAYGNSSN